MPVKIAYECHTWKANGEAGPLSKVTGPDLDILEGKVTVIRSWKFWVSCETSVSTVCKNASCVGTHDVGTIKVNRK
jgi:hypothetical protein